MPTSHSVPFETIFGTAAASGSAGFARRSTRADERGIEAIAMHSSKQLCRHFSFAHSPYRILYVRYRANMYRGFVGSEIEYFLYIAHAPRSLVAGRAWSAMHKTVEKSLTRLRVMEKQCHKFGRWGSRAAQAFHRVCILIIRVIGYP